MAVPDKPKVAVLGLGAMGSRLATNILDAGHEVMVWNRSQPPMDDMVKRGAKAFDTPRATAAEAEIVLSMVTDDDAAKSVWLDAEKGAVHGLKPEAVAIESSTVTPGWVRSLAEAVEGTGASFLDCPISGSLPQAEARELVVLAGGSDDAFRKAEPTLVDMAGKAKHVGAVGQGIAMKLAVNALLGIEIAAFAEAVGFLRKSGLDEDHALEVIADTVVASPGAVAAAKLMLKHDFKPRFPIDLVEKDFRYTLATGKQIDAPLPVTDAVWHLLDRLKGDGHGKENISALARGTGLDG